MTSAAIDFGDDGGSTAAGVAGFTTDAGSLEFWEPVEDTPITETYLPAGPVAPGSSADASVRVHNTSDGYTATGIVLATTPPLDGSVADGSGQMLVSADGIVFARTAAVADLHPGATSGVLWLRRITPPDAAPGDTGYLLTATAAAWLPAMAGTADTAEPPAGEAFDPGDAQPLVDDPEEQM
jgi:hypothetical protein